MFARLFLPRVRSFSQKYLSPGDRFQEIIYGLIMVLTVSSTLQISLQNDPNGSRAIIFAALGCNAAWGFVDGIMFIVTNGLRRSRFTKFIKDVKKAPDEKAALRQIEDELSDSVIWTLGKKERKRITQEVVRSAARITPRDKGVEREDIVGAVLCFFIVFSSTFPVIIPLLFVPNHIQSLWTAMRISNAIAIGMLFATGYEFAGYTDRSRLRVGSLMVLTGLAIVMVTVALGG